MHYQRRRFTISALALSVAATLPLAAAPALVQQGYPDKPIRLIVPFPAGGPTDTAARIIGQKMGREPKRDRGDRQPPRRLGHHRRRGRGQVRARWLHAADAGHADAAGRYSPPRKSYDLFKDLAPSWARPMSCRS